MFRIFTKTLPSLASRGVVKNGGLVLRNGSCLDHSSNTLTTIRNFAEAPKQNQPKKKDKDAFLKSIEARFESMDKLKEVFGDLVTLEDLEALESEGVILEDLSEEEMKSLLKRRKVKEAHVDINWQQYFPTKYPEPNYTSLRISEAKIQEIERNRVLQDFALFKQGYEQPLIDSLRKTHSGRLYKLTMTKRNRNRQIRAQDKVEKIRFWRDRREQRNKLFLPQNQPIDPLSDSIEDFEKDLTDPMKMMDINQTTVAEVNPYFKNPALWWRHANLGKKELTDRVLQELARTRLPLRDEYAALAKKISPIHQANENQQMEEDTQKNALSEDGTKLSKEEMESKQALEDFLTGINERTQELDESLLANETSDPSEIDFEIPAGEKSELARNQVTEEYPILFTTVHRPHFPDVDNWRALWIEKQLERRVFMKVLVSALKLPKEVEQRLIELAQSRYKDGVLSVSIAESQNKLRNKFFCKQIVRDLLTEAWKAHNDYLPLDTNNAPQAKPKPFLKSSKYSIIRFFM